MAKKPLHYIIENEELMKEWNHEKNNELNHFPDQLSIHSSIVAWWKCKKAMNMICA